MFYLGVDGGGTHTRFVLADEAGDVVRTATEGPGNAAVLSEEELIDLLEGALIDLAGEEAAADVRHAALGFAGLRRAAEQRKLDAALTSVGVARFTLMTDAELHYRAVLGEKRGVLLSAGTGSVCVVRTADDDIATLGGWGYLLGDEGSGHFIGRRAIRAALDDEEVETEASPLTRDLLGHFGVAEPNDLVSAVYSAPSPQEALASAARPVCQLAALGEPTALLVVDAAADALLALLERGLSRLGTPSPWAVGLTGGLLADGSPVSEALQRKADEIGLDLVLAPAPIEPAAAAVLVAREHAGAPATEAFVERMREVTF